MLGGCTAELLGLRAPFALIAALNGAAAVHAIALLRESLPSAAAAPAHAAAAHASAGAAGAALASTPSLPTSSGKSSGPPSSRSEPPQPAGARTATRASGRAGSGWAGSGWAAALCDARFVGAGVMHAASFALRQGGRNMLLALVAVEQFGYSSGELGLLLGAMATADLLAVGAASRAADRAHGDARGVVLPGVLGSALACACIGAFAAGGLPSGEPTSAVEHARHPLFLAGVAAWAVATASVGPALPAFAAGLAREPTHRGAYVALFRTSGDVGFVLAPLALGYLADYSGAPNAMVALAGVVASAAGVFSVFGKPRKLGRSR